LTSLRERIANGKGYLHGMCFGRSLDHVKSDYLTSGRPYIKRGKGRWARAVGELIIVAKAAFAHFDTLSNKSDIMSGIFTMSRCSASWLYRVDNH
jgi:hypothetical protein